MTTTTHELTTEEIKEVMDFLNNHPRCWEMTQGEINQVLKTEFKLSTQQAD